MTHRKIETVTEEHTTFGGLPLRLSLGADAIVDHFDADESPEAEAVRAMTPEQLAGIGYDALTNDCLYKAFHAALLAAVRDQRPAQ